MQEAIPYRTYIHPSATITGKTSPESDGVSSSSEQATACSDVKRVQKIVVDNAVAVFGRRGCCMCHVVKTLLVGHGVNPAAFEVDEGDEAAVANELWRISGVDTNDGDIQFPAVFVGGKLFGGLEQVMGAHISGELVPILKDAGALWL